MNGYNRCINEHKGFNMTEDTKIEHSYLRYKDHIHNIIYRLSNDQQITMDVVQQTYLKSIIENSTNNLTKSQLINTARQVLYNDLLINNHVALDSIDQSTELRYFNENTDKATISSIHHALRKLQLTIECSLNRVATASKELLILYFIENLSIIEISCITQRSIIDIKVNLHHSIIIFDIILVNNMKGKLVSTAEQCHIYSKKCEKFINYRIEIPRTILSRVNLHISNCAACLDNNKQLKLIGIVLNIIPIIKATPRFEESVQLKLKQQKLVHLLH